MKRLGSISLDAAGAELIRLLGGTWRGDRGMCLCPAHTDVEPSLSVRIGHTRLLFHCFAGCDTRDVLRAIARIRPEALDRGSGVVRASADDDRVAQWRRQRMLDLWADGFCVHDDLAGRYLVRRAIDIAPPTLRFQPLTPLGTGRALRLRPAMLAAVTDGPRLAALQRTFLDRLGRRARDITNPRRLWGCPGAGAVRLAAANDDLALAEGVESGLSAMILLGLPVWAVLGSQRMAQVDIPDTVRRLILLPDNDLSGRRGAAAAAIVHAAPGRTIETIWPWHGLNDWNDVLRARRRGGVEELRQAA